MSDLLHHQAQLPWVIEQAIERARDLAGDKPVAVIAEYPAHLPPVRGDSPQLIDVVECLVDQALKLTNEGEVRVRARMLSGDQNQSFQTAGLSEAKIHALTEDGPWAMVSVAYSGDDAPEGHQRALTEDDATLAGGTLPTPLFTCRRIIEREGGLIWFDHPSDETPRFNFTLPLHATSNDLTEVSALRRLVETYLPEGSEKVKSVLLLVEDTKLMEVLEEELNDFGYRVVAAESGRDVVPLARSMQPDLILLDLMARDPAALDLAMVLKQDRRTSGIPLLFLTAFIDPHVGVRMGAVNFVVRPEGTGAMVATIRAVLGSGISPSGRVLVVEPDNATREMIIMMIQNQGYRVTEASGPEEALALAEHVSPEVILVNARVAQEGDYWLLRSLRQLGESFEVYVLAEALTEAEGRAAVSRGASGFSETGKLPDLLSEVWRRRTSED